MTNPLIRIGIVALAGLALCTLSLAGGTLRVQIDQPIVIANQVFSAGTLEFRPVGLGDLVALHINGRRVGLIFAPELCRPSLRPVSLVFHRDTRRLAHLRGCSIITVSGKTEFKPLQVASVLKGNMTLPPTLPWAGTLVADGSVSR